MPPLPRAHSLPGSATSVGKGVCVRWGGVWWAGPGPGGAGGQLGRCTVRGAGARALRAAPARSGPCWQAAASWRPAVKAWATTTTLQAQQRAALCRRGNVPRDTPERANRQCLLRPQREAVEVEPVWLHRHRLLHGRDQLGVAAGVAARGGGRGTGQEMNGHGRCYGKSGRATHLCDASRAVSQRLAGASRHSTGYRCSMDAAPSEGFRRGLTQALAPRKHQRPRQGDTSSPGPRLLPQARHARQPGAACHASLVLRAGGRGAALPAHLYARRMVPRAMVSNSLLFRVRGAW